MALCLAGPALGAPADHDFADGVRTAREGDYAQALISFQAARGAGIDTAALHYNIGVCHYKLGQYQAAREAFLEVPSGNELSALASYNLGLTALRLDEREEAANWFRRTAEQSSHENLTLLAQRQLSRLQGAPTAPAKGKWMASASANVGYDDNVVDPAGEAGVSKEDSFLELFAWASGPVRGTRQDGLRLDLSAYAGQYATVSAYDMDVLRGGLAWTRPLGAWQGEAAYHLEQNTLDGEDFLRTGTVSAGAARPLSETLRLRLRYRYSALRSLTDTYDPVQGQRQQFDIETRWSRAATSVRLGYQLELNDREDERTTTTFTSFSPTRHSLRLGTEHEFDGGSVAGLELRLRDSRYNDANLLEDGSRDTRNDTQGQARLNLGWPLGRGVELTANYEYTDNDSNLAAYDYSRNMVLMGLTKNW